MAHIRTQTGARACPPLAFKCNIYRSVYTRARTHTHTRTHQTLRGVRVYLNSTLVCRLYASHTIAGVTRTAGAASAQPKPPPANPPLCESMFELYLYIVCVRVCVCVSIIYGVHTRGRARAWPGQAAARKRVNIDLRDSRKQQSQKRARQSSQSAAPRQKPNTPQPPPIPDSGSVAPGARRRPHQLVCGRTWCGIRRTMCATNEISTLATVLFCRAFGRSCSFE